MTSPYAEPRVFREAGLPPGYARFQRAFPAKRPFHHDNRFEAAELFSVEWAAA